MSRNDGSTATFKILKALLDGERPSDIARRFEVSRQWIDTVKRKGIEAGFPLTIRKQKG